MRNSTDDIHAQIKSPDEIIHTVSTQQSILGKGNQLKINVGRHLPLDVQHCLDCKETWVGDVHMGANGQCAASDRPSAKCKGPLYQRISCQMGLQLTPELYSLQQGAALIDPGQSIAEGRVKVKMAINKGSRYQISPSINDRKIVSNPINRRTNIRDNAVPDQDI